MKKVLFLTPCYQYAKTVVNNTSRDLNRSNIPFTSSIVPGSMWIRTNNVDVTITYEDPITWNCEMLQGVDAVYGKKELLAKLREVMFRIMPPNPDVSFIRYLKMHSDNNLYDENTIPANTKYIPTIKNVYFNEPMTIVMWEDGTKTMVKCQDGDVYSKEVGLTTCIAKKALGNKGNFNNIFKKWIPDETEVVMDFLALDCGVDTTNATKAIEDFYNNMKNFFGGKKHD